MEPTECRRRAGSRAPKSRPPAVPPRRERGRERSREDWHGSAVRRRSVWERWRKPPTAERKRGARPPLSWGSDYGIIPAVPETVETHRFEVTAAWSGDGAGAGRVSTEDGVLAVPIAGAVVLGGSGGKANPEELFLAAIASCFVN